MEWWLQATCKLRNQLRSSNHKIALAFGLDSLHVRHGDASMSPHRLSLVVVDAGAWGGELGPHIHVEAIDHLKLPDCGKVCLAASNKTWKLNMNPYVSL